MSQVIKPENAEAKIAPEKLIEEKGSINLSEEAQMKLFELVLTTPFVSPEDLEKEETPKI